MSIFCQKFRKLQIFDWSCKNQAIEIILGVYESSVVISFSRHFQCFLPDVPWTLILYKLYTVVVWYSNLNDKRLSDNRNPKVSPKKTWSKFLDDAPEETWHYRSESNQKTWPRWCKLNCWPWMRKIRADDNNIDFDCSIIVGGLIEESSYEVFRRWATDVYLKSKNCRFLQIRFQVGFFKG